MKANYKGERLGKLIGLMAQYEITTRDMAAAIGKSAAAISNANTGKTYYNAKDMINIQAYLEEKTGTRLTLEEIFFQ